MKYSNKFIQRNKRGKAVGRRGKIEGKEKGMERGRQRKELPSGSLIFWCNRPQVRQAGRGVCILIKCPGASDVSGP